MKIAMIGMGKLGLPVALAIESKGHEVRGFDTVVKSLPQSLPNEEGADKLLSQTKITFDTPDNLAQWADIVFIAVQTPHEKEYEGITPLPDTRKDFDYSYLIEACKSVKDAKGLVVIISTVLPGTIEREIKPIIPDVIYNPSFIAMGMVIENYLNPEFVLIGCYTPDTDYEPFWEIANFYETIHNLDKIDLFDCTIQEAEVIKVSYNTWITAKICLSNTIMELCHKTGANCDTVTNALGLATDRIVSTKYMKGGMGDGGGCHPRDNIALSYLAQKLNLSYDIYEVLMKCRDKQTKWLAQIAEDISIAKDLPLVILGKAFKRDSPLTTGSAAMLLTHYLTIPFTHYDPLIDKGEPPIKEKAVYFIATNHTVFKTYEFPQGSEVIDVWRYLDNATLKIGHDSKL